MAVGLIKGEKTLIELAQDFDVHPNQFKLVSASSATGPGLGSATGLASNDCATFLIAAGFQALTIVGYTPYFFDRSAIVNSLRIARQGNLGVEF